MAARAGSGVAKAAAESGLINASRRDEKRYADDTTWNRRAFVGQMGSSEINASAGAVGNSFQRASNAYGNAASDMQQSANAGYQTAGQFAGMGLSMLSPTKTGGGFTKTLDGIDAQYSQSPTLIPGSSGSPYNFSFGSR